MSWYPLTPSPIICHLTRNTHTVLMISRNLAIETIQLLLQVKYDERANRLGHAQILRPLKFCLKTYFTFNGTIYESVKGTPMGLPISGLIAEAVLQRWATLEFRHHRLKFWARAGVSLQWPLNNVISMASPLSRDQNRLEQAYE
ncbi:unnamed protein product [Dibothriocephalus latus]|uniref:Reverse transcriptase domain-containing protein n=1 Tax=Dibothriocephalus latus TaxID=60516 RepID=A0A3P7LVI0_DIBLA|nr:unnamed protein product [Dibothriocephalus latus]